MAMNNRGLGRGISALLGSGNDSTVSEGGANSPLTMAAIDAISPNPAQPREHFAEDALEELASSIASHGILQPLLVRPVGGEGRYQLIAGERRLRAARLAGLSEVPVLVRDLDDNEALIVTLLENLQREDLNPIEEAKGLEALKDAMNVSVEQLAETLGQGRSTIAHSLRLLRLEQSIQDDLAAGRISTSHAKALSAMPHGEALQEIRQYIVDNGLTTRETEEAIAYWNEHKQFPWSRKEEEGGQDAPQNKRVPKVIDPDIAKLAHNIGAALNCRTKINGNAERGRISITYESNAQLYELLDKFGMTLMP